MIFFETILNYINSVLAAIMLALLIVIQLQGNTSLRVEFQSEKNCTVFHNFDWRTVNTSALK